MATDATKIKEIYETGLSDADLGVYASQSNTFVSSVLTEAGVILPTGIQELIETYLAAHLINISRERQAAKESAGTADIQYTGKYEMGLMMTSYGQMVLSLDTSGTFASLGKRTIKIQAVEEDFNNYSGQPLS